QRGPHVEQVAPVLVEEWRVPGQAGLRLGEPRHPGVAEHRPDVLRAPARHAGVVDGEGAGTVAAAVELERRECPVWPGRIEEIGQAGVAADEAKADEEG